MDPNTSNPGARAAAGARGSVKAGSSDVSETILPPDHLQRLLLQRRFQLTDAVAGVVATHAYGWVAQ